MSLLLWLLVFHSFNFAVKSKILKKDAVILSAAKDLETAHNQSIVSAEKILRAAQDDSVFYSVWQKLLNEF